MATVALPTSRNISHPSGTVIKGTTLDDLQDSVIGRKHPDRTIQIHPHAWLNPGWVASTGEDSLQIFTGPLYFAIPLAVGDRLTSITIARNGPFSADRDMRVKLRKTTAAGVGSYIFDTADDNVANVWAERTFTTSLPVTVAAGETFSILIVPISNPNQIFIGPSRVVVDRL